MVLPSGFQKTINQIDKKVKLMAKEVNVIKYLLDSFKYEDAYDSILKLEDMSEKTVLLTRTLPIYSGKPRAEYDVNEVIADNIRIKIGFTEEGWFSVRMPLLLPRKEYGNAQYIRSALYPAMKEFFSLLPPIRFTDCVLIYRHIYSSDKPDRRKRDHDNIEINMISDIVALYVMLDDGPDTCSHYYCSRESEIERTEVYVVPKDEFSTFVIAEPKMPTVGVKLYEKRFEKVV